MDTIYRCTFGRDEWETADWLALQSPRWPQLGAWLQGEDHIENRVPADATIAEMEDDRAGETYASMLYREPLEALRARAELAFAERMAPLIVLAAEPGLNEAGHPEYREHVEVVLFDGGINVWHHRWSPKKGPSWTKVAHRTFVAKAGRRYVLAVTRLGPALRVHLEQHLLDVELALPRRLYAGITGCEGRNRFYAFSLDRA